MALGLALAGCAAHPVAPPEWPVPPPAGIEHAFDAAPEPTRVLYLVDLFDAARLTGDAAARALLWRGLGLPAARGEEATARAIDALAARARSARLDALAALLEDDRAELAGEDEAAAMRDRRQRADAGGPAAPHALLSLYAFCARALTDAASSVPWRRAALADQCLRAISDQDPAVWFDGDAAARPPDPPWSALSDGLAALAARAARAAPRLARLCALLASARTQLAEAVEREGIEPPDAAVWAPRLPPGDPSLPSYDRSAWVLIDQDMALIGRARFTTRDHPLVERLEHTIAVGRLTPGRARLALFIPAEASADVVDSLGELGRRAGADALELVLAAPRSAKEDPGGGAKAARLVVLPLQLRESAGREQPREVSERAATLTLLVAPEGVTLLARDGAYTLGPIATIGERLAELARAFPDEAAVRLAIDPTARYRDVVETALAARARFRRVALVEVPHAPHKDELRVRVERRAAARVVVRGARHVGEALVRGCYLEALERAPELAATARIPPGARAATGVERDPELAECLARRVAAVHGEGEVTVEMAPR
jgi:hypothetical protein